jgi:predicted Zn-dependent protease with MMP-like domain
VIEVTDEQSDEMINQALESLPGEHVKQIANVAILRQDNPTEEQKIKLELRDDQLLYGLYEGVPLSERQGQTRIFPDKITLFKHQLAMYATSIGDLQEKIRHTLWHEIGHYYGLNHDQIHKLER